MAIKRKPAEVIKSYFGPDRVISSQDMVEQLGAMPTPKWVLKSALPTLDDLIGGFYPQEVTVISGITGEGKTLLCQTLTRNFGLRNDLCLWFSYEVRPQKFLPKFGPYLPTFYLPAKMTTNSLAWIFDRIHEGIEKYGIRAVFVDHLHYLLDMAKVRNASLQIGDLMRQIVNTAHELEIHFFLISHMAKIPREQEPGKGDARDSSFVEQEPDNVFYIWRRKEGNQSVLKVAKNRQNGVFGAKVQLEKIGDYLEEVEDVYN